MTFTELSNTTILAFGHRARHGKDLAAELVAQHFQGALRFGFADALKAVCRVQWGMQAKDASLLQRVGVAMRSIDSEIWLRALYWAIAERQPRIALITDMRFPNEFEMVRSMGGLTVKVERRNAAGELFVPTDRDPNHESEVALAHETRWDAVITNPEGRLDLYQTRVLETANTLIGARESRGANIGDPYGETQRAA